MSIEFRNGYEYYISNASSFIGSIGGDRFVTERLEYVGGVEAEISQLEKGINAFMGDHTPAAQLKGDIAEFWQAGTFNVDAATNDSINRVLVDRSNTFGSVDISSNFGQNYGLKYYSTGEESAKQQAISVFQRFKKYQSCGGTDTLDKYLADRNYSSDTIIDDPLYAGQIRVIPSDQMDEAIQWLERKIFTEGTIRSEQVKRYQETLELLRDRISDCDGNESIPLSREDAEKLAVLAKEGKFRAEDFGITAPELLSLEMAVKASLKAGMSAAIISLVLKIGPELFKVFDYLIKNGDIDKKELAKLGSSAIQGAAEGFIRGSVSAAIEICCKAGLLGESFVNVNPGIIGTIVAVTMNTLKSAFDVAVGKKTRAALSNELIRDLFVSSSSLVFGYAGQVILAQLPIVGYLVGSFVGSVIGSFAYNGIYKAALSFCIDTGITLFGLVEQDYSLPDDVIAEMGLQTFDYETFETETFTPDTFYYDSFRVDSIQPDSLGITFLRRGVIGISRIGYVE